MVMKTAAVVFGLVFVSAVMAFGQVRTVTNGTLEKFQQKRLAAERDYRENYQRLGFPSPEELEKQQEADMTARLQLAEQLRQARLEKERLELEKRSLDLQTARLESESEIDEFGGFYPTYFGGFGGSGFDSRRRPRRFRHGQFPFVSSFGRNRLLPTVDRQGAYRVTPFGVISVPNPRPIFRGRIVRGRPR